MPKLSDDEIRQRLTKMPGWSLAEGALEKKWEFGTSFPRAILFVNHVAGIAERLDHHPDIAVHWTTVTLRIWTHDEGGITERDFRLAEAIDAEVRKGK